MSDPEVEEKSGAKKQLHSTVVERDRALDELKGMKRVAEEANMRLSDALTTQPKVTSELDMIKQQLLNTKQQLKIKDRSIRNLKSEAERAKKLEAKLGEKDALLDKLQREMKTHKASESRIRELELELEERRDSETKMLDSLMTQTKQLEQTKIWLEEYKLMEKSKGSKNSGYPKMLGLNIELDNLRTELHLAKENLARADERERKSSARAKSLLEELHRVKTELSLVSEAEENGKKAMDDLAFALKEVATEANQSKEKLNLMQREVDRAKSEAAQAKFLLKSMENRYKHLLEEARKESEQHKNSCERLRLEAEESQMAWHEKETMFIRCIKQGEEETALAKRENCRLIEALSEAKHMINKGKEENKKLRDILKQALNEANVAKEAAGIARRENYQLKDNVAEKESALEILSREIENLRNNEAMAYDNIKELKKLLREAEASKTKSKPEVIEEGHKLSTPKSAKKEPKELKTLAEEFKDFKTDPPKEPKEPKDPPKEVKEAKDTKNPTEKEGKPEKPKNPTEKEEKPEKPAQNLKEAPKIPKEPTKDPKIPNPKDFREKENSLKKLSRNCSLNLKELKTSMNKEMKINPKEIKPVMNNDYDYEDEDSLMDDPLKGSIFDTASPVSRTPPQHKKSLSLSFADDRTMSTAEFSDHDEDTDQEHDQIDKSSRKRRPLFKRFGNMLVRKSFHRREPIVE